LTAKSDGQTTETYLYDSKNKLTSYSDGGTTASYTYDADDRRIEKAITDGATTKYFYDDLNCVAEYDENDTFLRSYVTPGLDDNLTIYTSSTVYYYIQDGLGSIRNIIDGSESIQNTYDYFAFGKDYGTPTENITNTFKFTGRRWDSESSQYYYRARYYLATVARFGQKDQILFADGSNNYLYAVNNPCLNVDPYGKGCRVLFDCYLVSSSAIGPCKTKCNYRCVEIPSDLSRQDSAASPTLDCEDINKRFGRDTRITTTWGQINRNLKCAALALASDWLARKCFKQPACESSIRREFLYGEWGNFDRSCSEDECIRHCQKIKSECDKACELPKVKDVPGCKLLCATTSALCEDACVAWCENE